MVVLTVAVVAWQIMAFLTEAVEKAGGFNQKGIFRCVPACPPAC